MQKFDDILKDRIHTSFFDEILDARKEFEFNFQKLWLTNEEYLEIENKFPYFSSTLLMEGLLFKKRKNNDWFKNRFCQLYQDRLLLFRDIDDPPYKVMILRGVTLLLFTDLRDDKEFVFPSTEIDEKTGFVLCRNKLYSIFSGGTKENFRNWYNELKKCTILTNFSKYYHNLKIIGRGTFAKVVDSERIIDGHNFAVKTFDKNNIENSKLSTRTKIGLINEINIMRRLEHENIIKLYEVYEGRYNIYIVLEKLKGGELFHRIIQNGNYNEKHASIIILQILKALDYMHKKGIVHRDVKPENLILSDEKGFEIKLADFGLSEIISKETLLYKRCGTPGYVAPEILDDKPYDSKCDIFSAGVILYILLSGFSPFYGKNYQDILIKNRKCEIDLDIQQKFNVKISEPAMDLLALMLKIDPTKRPSASECINHPWIVSSFSPISKVKHFESLNVPTNLLKFTELKIISRFKKNGKLTDLSSKSPFLSSNNDYNPQSPILTPDIRLEKEKFNTNTEENKDPKSNDSNKLLPIEEEEKHCKSSEDKSDFQKFGRQIFSFSSPLLGKSNSIVRIKSHEKNHKLNKANYFSSADLLSRKTKENINRSIKKIEEKIKEDKDKEDY